MSVQTKSVFFFFLSMEKLEVREVSHQTTDTMMHHLLLTFYFTLAVSSCLLISVQFGKRRRQCNSTKHT